MCIVGLFCVGVLVLIVKGGVCFMLDFVWCVLRVYGLWIV